jgi:hypothetical protein
VAKIGKSDGPWWRMGRRLRCRGRMAQGRKSFFFEKNNQKTFTFEGLVRQTGRRVSQRKKVFCFFFSKKKYFLTFNI